MHLLNVGDLCAFYIIRNAAMYMYLLTVDFSIYMYTSSHCKSLCCVVQFKHLSVSQQMDALDSFEDLSEMGHHLADLPVARVTTSSLDRASDRNRVRNWFFLYVCNRKFVVFGALLRDNL